MHPMCCPAIVCALRVFRGEHSFAVVRARRRAFTVIELLVVMAIMGVLAGLTIMSFSALGKRSSRAGAADNVKGLLRAAQTAAVDSGLGSLVRIDTAEGSLHGIANTVQAAWHLETVNGNITPGAKSMDGMLAALGAGALPTAGQPGVLGLSFGFDGVGGYVHCGTYPVYDQTEGIRVEAYVWPGATGPGYMGVIAKCYCPLAGITDPTSAGYILGLQALTYPPAPEVTYRVHSGFVITDANGNHVAVHLAYPPLVMPPPPSSDPKELGAGQWYHVATEFDGFQARLFLDGVPVAAKSYLPDPMAVPPWPGFAPPGHIVPAPSEPLTVGVMHYGMPPFVLVNDYCFQGLIDEPQVLSVAGGSHFKLPEGVPLVSSAPVVHYNGQGQLDIAYHTGPVYVTVGDPYQTAVLANDTGVTLQLQGRNPFPPTGGQVLVENEVITYASVAGRTLTGLSQMDGTPRITPIHAQGKTVYFARTITVSMTGTVGQL